MQLKAFADDEAFDSDRVNPRRAIPKPSSRPRTKTKAVRRRSPTRKSSPQSSGGRLVRLKVVQPSVPAASPAPAPLAVRAPVVLGLPEQSLCTGQRKKSVPEEDPEDLFPLAAKKRSCARSVAQLGHTSESVVEAVPSAATNVREGSLTVSPTLESSAEAFVDLTCLDLPADLGECVGNPITLEEIERLTFDEDVAPSGGGAETVPARGTPEPVCVRDAQQIAPPDCGITFIPKRAPVAAFEVSAATLAAFKDFTWKMWESFVQRSLLPMPHLDDPSVGKDLEFLFAKLQDAGFDISGLERCVRGYLSTARDLVVIRSSLSGKFTIDEQLIEVAKANEAIQQSLRDKEASASVFEKASGRVTSLEERIDHLRDQLKQAEAELVSSQTAADAAKKGIEVASRGLIAAEYELSKARTLPTISREEEGHLLSLESAFSSLKKELADFKCSLM